MTIPHWLSLNGKLALITGVGSPSGIGFAAAKALAELGATVFLTSQSERCIERAKELSELGYSAYAHPADLVIEGDRDELVQEVRKLGQLSILVNNAGMSSVLQPMHTTGESNSVEKTPLASFELALSRNLTSVFALIQACLPGLRATKGRIINIASVTGPVMAMRNEASYAAAKAGLVGLTKSLALDEAENGIVANAIAPGWIATDSQTELEAGQGFRIPLGRSAHPDEVGQVIAFLATGASSYITGQLIVVDGGNSIAEER